jgi:hypothetical protein
LGRICRNPLGSRQILPKALGLQISDFRLINQDMLYNLKSKSHPVGAGSVPGILRARRVGFPLQLNVKKTIALAAVGMLAALTIGCGGPGGTPTRTRVAESLATQTPWLIYVPVTVTPGPETATLEPTVTPDAPTATAVPPTKPPPTARPVQPTKAVQPTTPSVAPAATAVPVAAAPTASPAPTCGQVYQVTNLTFPENNATRRAKPGGGAGATIRFNWDPVASYELDPKLGYRVNVSTKLNSQALYISHNDYLKERAAILNQQATYGLTNGDDATASWSVDVIMTTGEFNDAGDDSTPPLGTVIVCGPPSPTFTIQLTVQ